MDSIFWASKPYFPVSVTINTQKQCRENAFMPLVRLGLISICFHCSFVWLELFREKLFVSTITNI